MAHNLSDSIDATVSAADILTSRQAVPSNCRAWEPGWQQGRGHAGSAVVAWRCRCLSAPVAQLQAEAAYREGHDATVRDLPAGLINNDQQTDPASTYNDLRSPDHMK